jgi:flagellar motor switch protein FliG
MSTLSPNLRKAAILFRGLDADMAAAMLSRLSPAEAKEIRLAIQQLGEIDEEERADVHAEFRRSGSVAKQDPRDAVELQLSTYSETPAFAAPTTGRSTPRPFEFLEQARVESLVPYLAREHAQTVAVVLSYLAPSRAAQVLAALPEKLQADAVERLSMLGDTDPSTLEVLERELADWVARQQATRTRPTQRIDTVAAILAAADQSTRREILSNLVKHNRELAQQVAPLAPKREQKPLASQRISNPIPVPPVIAPKSTIINHQSPIPQFPFDDLVRFDPAALTAVLKSVDAELLCLALVGANEALVDRITAQMPAKVAKSFRQRLHACGPTRLRDVEAAQHEVAAVAARIFHARHTHRQVVRA